MTGPYGGYAAPPCLHCAHFEPVRASAISFKAIGRCLLHDRETGVTHTCDDWKQRGRK